MSEARKSVILEAFNKADVTGDGLLTIDDLKVNLFKLYFDWTEFFIGSKTAKIFLAMQRVYNVKRNPKYLNGDCTEEEILTKFLGTFETYGVQDGIVSSLHPLSPENTDMIIQLEMRNNFSRE